MNTNKIVVNGKEFSDATHHNNDPGMTIYSCNLFVSNSLLGDELSIATLNDQLNCSGYAYTYFRPKDSSCYVTADNELFCVRPRVVILAEDPTTYKYGEKVQYYRNGTLIATLFMSSVKRVGKYIFAISCMSAIGLLDNGLHYGGVYTGDLVSQVLADIIGNKVTYSVDSKLQNMRVYGWLPVASPRENLQQLLFAEGGTAQSKANGDLYFKALQTGTATSLPNSRIFAGGSIEYAGSVTQVAVTEHTYTAFFADEEKTLFEGNITVEPLTTPKGKAVQGILITFNEPIHDLISVGASVLESGANYAVLGSGISCVLTGKSYTHSTRVVTRPDNVSSRALTSVKDNTAVVDQATLVNLVNVESVAERVYAYYKASRTISSDIIVSSERPGTYVSLSDPFDESAKGFVQSMDITVSQLLKANTKIVADYIPPLPGDYYSNVSILTTNQTWTVPSTCKGRIRVIVGGGGQGGCSGYSGGNGEKVDRVNGPAGSYFVPGTAKGYALGIPGEGGAGGDGGEGGKILQLTLAVTPGQTFAVTIGTGGAGGRYGDNTPGSLGNATKFGSYSSADGEVSAVGYIEQTNQVLYSCPGEEGIAGGRGAGGIGTSVDWLNASNVVDGTSVTDEDGTVWHCGTTQRADDNTIKRTTKQVVSDNNNADLEGGYVIAAASYALGGGAAAGSNGIDGAASGSIQASKDEWGNNRYILTATATGVPGTNGASATKKPKKQTIRGAGGRGGYGGGGAGGHGMALTVGVNGFATASINESQTGGTLGVGGSGGQGGDGGDGYVIIYW